MTSLTGVQVACARSGVAALVLLLLMPAWRGWWRGRPLLVGLAYGATMVGFVVANKLTLAANAIFLQSTAPLWVLILAPLALGERNRRSDLWVTATLFVGLSLFFLGPLLGSGLPAPTAPRPVLGNIIAVGTGFAWACTLIGLRWLARTERVEGRDEAGAAVVAGNVVGVVVCVPFAWPVASSAPGLDALAVLYLGVFQIALAYVLMTRGVRALPALEVSLLILLEPVASGIFAWLVLGERPGGLEVAGCAIILGATALRIALFGGAAGPRSEHEPSQSLARQKDK